MEFFLLFTDIKSEAKKLLVPCPGDILHEWQGWDLNPEPELFTSTLDPSVPE